MVRWLLVLVIGCDVAAPIERVGLRSECDGDRDSLQLSIEGRELCGRARLWALRSRPSGTEELIAPGAIDITVVAPLTAGDGTVYHFAVGLGQQTRLANGERLVSAIDPAPPRRSDKTDIYRGGFASLSILHPLDLPGRHTYQWVNPKAGMIAFDHYDLAAGTSRGSFEVVFEARTSGGDTTGEGTSRLIRARGTFQTATPIADDDGILRH